MRRVCEFALALAIFIGCEDVPYEDRGVFDHPPYGSVSRRKEMIEDNYRKLLFEAEKGYQFEGDRESNRVESISSVLEKYKSQAKVTLTRVLVGISPNETLAGYVERQEFPSVKLYNRDSGKYESVDFVFSYVRDVDFSPLPKAVILADGQTLLVGPKPGQDYVIGRYPLEVAALLALHICPVCGAKVHPTVFWSAARVDIDPDRVSGFKDEMVFQHTRTNRNYRPLAGLPADFWRHPGGHTCAAAGEKEFGEATLFPVRFEKVRSSELKGLLPKAGGEPVKGAEEGAEEPQEE